MTEIAGNQQQLLYDIFRPTQDKNYFSKKGGQPAWKTTCMEDNLTGR
jgi:hypothetical protein